MFDKPQLSSLKAPRKVRSYVRKERKCLNLSTTEMTGFNFLLFVNSLEIYQRFWTSFS